MRLLPPVLLALALAACGGSDDPAPAAGPEAAAPAAETPSADADPAVAAEPAPPPMPTGDFRVVAVDLDRRIDEEGRAVQPGLVFSPRDRIHAAVIGVGSSDALTLSARWLAPDGSQIAKAGQSLTPTQPTVTTFSIAQPEPWPAGAYQVEIAINDRVVETRAFEVR